MKKFFTITIFSGLFSLLKMFSGFIIGKVIAIYTGPSGIAMIGQMQSIISIISGILNSPVGSGIVRYTAENNQYGFHECAPWWRASLKISFFLYLVIIVLVIPSASYLSSFIFSSGKYSWLIILSCSVMPLTIANTFLSSILNGQQHYRQYIISGMVSVTISTIVLLIMTALFSLKGALISVSLNTAVSGLVLIIFCKRKDWFSFSFLWGKVDDNNIKGILSYSLMSFVSALSMPIALLISRKFMIAETGWENTGQWQAVWKISEAYLTIMTISLSTYLMPKLSSLNESVAIRKEVNTLSLAIIPCTIVLAFLIYITRDISVSLLFTNDFYNARELFLYQLIGDVFKIAGFVFAYPMLAQGRVRIFVISEIFFSFTFVIFVCYFMRLYGIQGANIGYMLNYIFYFSFAFIFTNIINPNIK
ncbi:O-antigen translocase [Escherichia albertii]|uniref:O-antigen translocase n=1 Tax=Escherichia albertii TaxID=208962 RepID=UPI001374C510|nr:O-antigen translocase [Escherichia albertii]MCU7289879.1 O-antigen translocase [Escherichia albertii]QTA15953.1 O-antigen translocase [Escherichia albertii]HAX3034874.1 O-antigen translocase [Escherichia albertii]